MLKQLIALATIDAPHSADGTAVEFEITVEAVRHRVPATVVKTPFFNPPGKPLRSEVTAVGPPAKTLQGQPVESVRGADPEAELGLRMVGCLEAGLHLYCDCSMPSRVLFAHGGAVAASMAAGALVATTIARPRSR